MDPVHQKPPRPTLEDLLRFKRAERPAPQFWAEFERGLRQKQLTALLSQPRGWARMRPVLVRGLRWTIPIAAATAVAVVVVRTSSTQPMPGQPTAVASSSAPSVGVTPTESRPTPGPVQVASATVGHNELSESPDLDFGATVAPAAPMPVAEPVAIALAPASAERVLPWSAATLGVREESPALFRPVVHSSRRARETDARVSSWTSSLARAESPETWNASESQMLQLTALDLRVSAAYADNLPTARAIPGGGRRAAVRDEREFRELESRFDATGSKLSIRF